MEGSQIYKAKSSLAALLLLLFAGTGGRSCKSLHLSPDVKQENVRGNKTERSHPDSTRQDVHVVKSHSPTPIDSKVGISEDEQPASPIVEAAVIGGMSSDLIRVETKPAEEELSGLMKNLPLEKSIPNDERKPDDSGKTPGVIISGNIPANTGSSFFNSEVQPNMNDQIKAIFTTKLLYDSVTASSNKDFIYNTLTVNNTSDAKLVLQVIITSPSGWQMVTTNIVNLTLEPFASTIIPMRFSPTGNNTAQWQQVKIEYRLNNVVDTRKTYFKMKVQEYSGFKATLPNSNLVLTSYIKSPSIPLYVKNSGNTEGAYQVSVVNQLLKLSTNFTIRLKPGKDTLMNISFPLSESQFAMLKKEEIRIAVANEKKETINMIQSIAKVGHLLKDHASAFLDMPLQFETGIMYQGDESPMQYYGAVYGFVDFDDDNHLAMSFRSNTIAKGQTNKNSMMRMDFTGKHLQASAGNIQGAGEFTADGYGARLGYQFNENKRVEAYGVLKSRTGDTKLFGGSFQTIIKDRIKINDAIAVSKDEINKTNSGIITQVSEIKFDKGRFALITGFGAEQKNLTNADAGPNTLRGTSFGYNFQWSDKNLTAFSNMLYNSNSYPGVFKGQRLQMHDVRWRKNNFSMGGFYEYNFRQQNYWQDTTYYKDVFNLLTTNYGFRTGVNFNKGNVMLAAGNQRQLQQGTDNFQTSYNYLNLNFSSLIAKAIHVNVNSFGGVISEAGKSNGVFVSTSQGSVQVKGFGTTFRYDKGPYFYQEFAAYNATPQKYERIILSPFVEANLLKKSLNTRVQANYARTQPSDATTTNVLANINYSHPDGYDFNINGIVPLGGEGSRQPFVSASLRMRIKAPCIAIRKYYNLKLILFKDNNSNGIRDADEEPIGGQTISLNGDLFVSDANGTILYKNTEKGLYKADFGLSSKLKGWIPSNGMMQQFELSSNKAIDVPYKTSRVLNGQLIVHNDSLSNVKFRPSNIKITATGSTGETYSTLTDEQGEFYFNLPSDNYIVTLSEAAFSEQFWPVQLSQSADLVNNQAKSVYFEIKQKKRQINIRKK